MKKALLLTLLVAGSSYGVMAGTAILNMDNYTPIDGNGMPLNPVYYLSAGTKAEGDVWVQVFGAAQGGDQTALIQPVKAEWIDGANLYIWGTSQYSFPASVVGGSKVDLTIKAWTGGTTFETATYAATKSWTQDSGNQLDPLIAVDKPLEVGGALTMTQVVPEPTTIALALIGGAALFLRRRQ